MYKNRSAKSLKGFIQAFEPSDEQQARDWERREKNMSEYDHAIRLASWRDDLVKLNPELLPGVEDLHHIPPEASSTINVVKQVASGLNGVPNYFLPVPMGQYHGLYLIFKKPGDELTKEQQAFIKRVNQRGYKSCLCIGWRAGAIAIIKHYMIEHKE